MTVRLASHWEFDSSWQPLDAEFTNGYPNNVIGKLDHFLSTQRALHAEDRSAFYPEEKDIFRAFTRTSLDNLKVVILGQDPYHNGQATGLAFSVENKRLTSSLHSIYAAIEADLGLPARRTGDLTPWAKDGVLLLNTTLTVAPGEAKSHSGAGWECFTNRVVEVINEHACAGVVFLLWGEWAWEKATLVDHRRHYVLAAAHPRAGKARLHLSRGRHFSLANVLLEAHGRKGISWLRA